MAECVDDRTEIIVVKPPDDDKKYDNIFSAENAVIDEERSDSEGQSVQHVHMSNASSDDNTEQLTNAGEKDRKDADNSERNGQLWILRIAKFAAVSFVVLCATIGTTVNKVTLVSITGRMHDLSSNFCDYNKASELSMEDQSQMGSICFFQLVAIMIIPDFVSFLRCLIWGVAGKTTDTFPWPTWKSILLVRV